MRRALAVLAAFVALGAACTPGSDADVSSTTTLIDATSVASETVTTAPVTTTSEAPDGYGGRVVVGLWDAPVTLNPFAPSGWTSRMAGNAVWAKVFDRDPDTWDFIPRLVTGMPSEIGAIEVNDDGTMTVRYEIVRGATWSDGVPITGKDLAWTAAALRDLALAGTFGQGSVLAEITEIDSVDRLAFITFARPTLEFEAALWIVLPSHVLDGVDLVDGTDGSDWPSGGPFVIEEFEPGQSVTLIRNDAFWGVDDAGGPLPYLDGLEIVGAGSNEDVTLRDLVQWFGDRQVDVSELYLPGGEWSSVLEGGAVVQTAITPIVEQVTFQFGDGRYGINDASANEDIRLRQAISEAIDREALATEAGVPWVPVRGLLDPTSDTWADGGASAVSLIDALEDEMQATPVSILSTTSNADERPAIAQALGAQLEAVGIDYDYELLDSTLFFGDVFTAGAFDIGLWAWSVQDPVELLRSLDPSANPPEGDWSGWGTLGTEAAARFTEIRLAAESTISRDELDALVEEAELILATELPLVPLFSRATYSAHWPDAVTGVRPNGTQSGLTWNIETWQVPGE